MHALKLFSVAAILAAAMPASAASVFSDGFEADAPGLGYSAATTSFNVTRGSVDVLAPGGFGLPCNSGNRCVDLGGTSTGAVPSADGRLTSKSTFSFNAGDTVTLSFQIAGNQRAGSVPDGDVFGSGFSFVGVGDLASRGFNYGTGTVIQDGGVFGAFSTSQGVFPADAYALKSIFFTANSAGSFTFNIFSDDADDFGPLLDDINLDITPGVAGDVPEPATWGMMLLGFGVAGAAIRRRDRGLAAA